MSFRGNPNVVNLTDAQTISGVKTFSADTTISGKLSARNGGNSITAAAKEDNTFVVTTAGKSKAASGYYKLGNGLIIQWGRFTNTNNTFTVTLPTPFTANNYSIAYGCLDSQRSGDNTITTNTTSTTNFTGWISCHSTTLKSQWVAIGY